MKKVFTPLNEVTAYALKAGEEVLLDGVVYTARDQAHQCLTQALKEKKPLPISLSGQVFYYCGPTPALPGRPIGSCGPTTSARMDDFTPLLLENGLKGMIGKGERSEEVIKAIKKYRAVYFLAYAGCGALIAEYIQSARLVAYKGLGPEAIYRLEVRNFPLIVGIDARGKSVFV
ncbi:MAG: FumA C-terminus/TtdB family hydratase beta subunit [Candidatus Omnitrophota bacterium]